MDTGPIHMEQAKQLLEFSSDDVLDHFFDAALLNKFPAEQKAMLRQFKIVVYSKKDPNGKISGVYQYRHTQDLEGILRQKTEVSLTLAELYVLFNFLLFIRRFTVATEESVGEWSATTLLSALSDQSSLGLDHLNVEFVPPSSMDNYDKNLVLGILTQTLKINFASLLNSGGYARVIAPEAPSHRKLHRNGIDPAVRTALQNLTFTKLCTKIELAVMSAGKQYAAAELAIQTDIARMPEKSLLADEPYVFSAQEITELNQHLQNLNLDAKVTADRCVQLPDDMTKNTVLQNLLLELRFSIRLLSNGNEITHKAQRPIYNKKENSGELISNHTQQALYDEITAYLSSVQMDVEEFKTKEPKSFYHIAGLVKNPPPQLKLLIDNIAHGNLESTKFSVYRQEQKTIRPISCSISFQFANLLKLSHFQSNDCELILLHALANHCLKLQAEIRSRTA